MTRSEPDETSWWGCQTPRLELVPDGDEHPDGNAALELVEAAGLILDPWQKSILRKSLLMRDGKWAAFEVATCIPRQNGKNALLEARELAGLFILGERLLIHSAHLADTAKEAFRRLEELIDGNDWLSREVKHIWRTNGHEAIELHNGQRIRFRTRTKGGGRGFSADWIGFDEAMILPETSLGAILPVVSARPNPQVWYTGSAVDQVIHEDGVVFSRLRHRALTGNEERLFYSEWSVEGHPDEVDRKTLADKANWAIATPGGGRRITYEAIENELQSMDPRTFSVERLGMGDWFALDGSDSILDLRKWGLLADPDSQIVGPMAFVVDVSPSRTQASIAVAGIRADGLIHIEIIPPDPEKSLLRPKGTGWIVPRLKELQKHNPVAILCDSIGPASSLLPELEQAGVVMTTVNSTEHAQACGLLFDAVEQGTLRHLGTPELSSAIKGAAQRPLGEAWAWSRKNSSVDITPLVASTLAHWAISKHVEGEIMVAWG